MFKWQSLLIERFLAFEQINLRQKPTHPEKLTYNTTANYTANYSK